MCENVTDNEIATFAFMLASISFAITLLKIIFD